MSDEDDDSSDMSSEDEDYNSRARRKAIQKKATKKALSISSRPIIKKKPTQVEKSGEQFQCDKCGEVFSSGWALGGHASRVHPGESAAYRKKIQRREERANERQLLALAKQRHMEVYGVDAPINRVKIRKFKRELRL
jgi:hypothetical protein